MIILIAINYTARLYSIISLTPLPLSQMMRLQSIQKVLMPSKYSSLPEYIWLQTNKYTGSNSDDATVHVCLFTVATVILIVSTSSWIKHSILIRQILVLFSKAIWGWEWWLAQACRNFEQQWWRWGWRSWWWGHGWLGKIVRVRNELTTNEPLPGGSLQRVINPFTPESDQCQNSPAAPPEILHHTVWRTWLFIAYSDERWL